MVIGRGKVSVRDDYLHRTNLIKEKKCWLRWKESYDWMSEEYIKLQKEMKEYTKLIEKGKHERPPETRSMKPWPTTTSGEIGWLSTRQEFQLQKWGPDIMLPSRIKQNNLDFIFDE